jgi:hypothetical protein
MRYAALWISALLVIASPLAAAELAVPVLLESPPCPVERLGPLTAEVGMKVNESTQDAFVPTVRAGIALQKLATKALEVGGNAVILRARQGVYFTLNGRRSSAPVYIKLIGGAIRLPDDISACRLVYVDAEAMDREFRGRPPSQTTSRRAYAED